MQMRACNIERHEPYNASRLLSPAKKIIHSQKKVGIFFKQRDLGISKICKFFKSAGENLVSTMSFTKPRRRPSKSHPTLEVLVSLKFIALCKFRFVDLCGMVEAKANTCAKLKPWGSLLGVLCLAAHLARQDLTNVDLSLAILKAIVPRRENAQEAVEPYSTRIETIL